MTRTPASLSIVFRVKRSGWSSARHGDGAAEASARNTIKRRAPARRPVRSDGKEDTPCDPDRVRGRPKTGVERNTRMRPTQGEAGRGVTRLLPRSKSCRLNEKGDRTMQIVRYLALGDSYTIGERVEPGERWPAQLASLLRHEGLAALEPEIIARTGWTTDELMADIERAAPEGRFDLVSLLIGVNDQYRGRDAEEYRGPFRTLLERAVAFAGGEAGRVVVVSIPDWGATPFARGRDRARIAA